MYQRLIKIAHLISKIKCIIIGVFKIKDVINQSSYFPDESRKSKFKRFTDNLKWLLKYGEVNWFYNLYGFDVGHSTENFIDYTHFMYDRSKLNGTSGNKSKYNYACILRDKFLFGCFLKSIGAATPEIIAVMREGIVYDVNNKMQSITDKDFFKVDDGFFLKAVAGECADGVYYMHSDEEFFKRKNDFNKGVYILQKRIYQNQKMNEVNPCCVNTLRMVTVSQNGEPKLLTAVMRIGTSQSGNVDNWAKGGLCVAIDDNGKLKEYAYYKPGHGGRVTTHPDTGLVFKDFEIPFYHEAKELILSVHKSLYGIHSIGWDVAITDDGPMLIEGNDNWEISLMQAADKPLKKEWKQSLS